MRLLRNTLELAWTIGVALLWLWIAALAFYVLIVGAGVVNGPVFLH